MRAAYAHALPQKLARGAWLHGRGVRARLRQDVRTRCGQLPSVSMACREGISACSHVPLDAMRSNTASVGARATAPSEVHELLPCSALIVAPGAHKATRPYRETTVKQATSWAWRGRPWRAAAPLRRFPASLMHPLRGEDVRGPTRSAWSCRRERRSLFQVWGNPP